MLLQVSGDTVKQYPSRRRGQPVWADAPALRGLVAGLVAADLDGTLLSPDLTHADGLPEALRRLRADGALTVICTGRMFRSARLVAARLGVDRGPIVCYQGALVADLASGEELRHVRMDGAVAAEVVRHVNEMGRHLNVYMDDLLYVERVTDWARLYAEQVEVGIHTLDDLAGEVVRRPPTKLVLVSSAADVADDPPRPAGALAGTPLRHPLAGRLYRVHRRLRQQERGAGVALRAAGRAAGAGRHPGGRDERRRHARVGRARRRRRRGGGAGARGGRPRRPARGDSPRSWTAWTAPATAKK